MFKKISKYVVLFVFFLLCISVVFEFIINDKVFGGNVVVNDCKSNLDSYDCAILKPESKLFKFSKSINESTLINISLDSSISDFKQDYRYIFFKSDAKLESNEIIGTFSYKLSYKKLIKRIIYILFISIVFYLFALLLDRLLKTLPAKTKLESSLESLDSKDKLFLSFAWGICLALFIFQFWLGFPGFYIIGDTLSSIALGKNNFHPVFISYVLELLYNIFGKHSYYLFLFNLIPFYLGLAILISGFYLRFKSYFSLLLLLIVFVGNIYFQNFIQYHSFSLPMLLFCLYSMILFVVLNPRFYKAMMIPIFIFAFFAILWRHNAIFSVFPIFIILAFLFLKDRGLVKKDFIKKYTFLLISSAVLCLVVVTIIPRILIKGESFPANHTFLHQIAGACVPAKDSSCYNDEWYYPHKNFNDVIVLYEKYPLNADPFNVTWGYDDERPFKPEKLQGLSKLWLKAIMKYPSNFLKHEMRFFKAMWFVNPGWIFSSNTLQTKAEHEWRNISVVSSFKESERSITFSDTQEKIYNFLFKYKITFNHIFGVASCFIVLLFSSIILIIGFYKENLSNLNLRILVFSFGVSFAGFFSAVFIAAFSPFPETRYMSTILPLGLLALISFVTFLINLRVKKEV